MRRSRSTRLRIVESAKYGISSTSSTKVFSLMAATSQLVLATIRSKPFHRKCHPAPACRSQCLVVGFRPRRRGPHTGLVTLSENHLTWLIAGRGRPRSGQKLMAEPDCFHRYLRIRLPPDMLTQKQPRLVRKARAVWIRLEPNRLLNITTITVL